MPAQSRIANLSNARIANTVRAGMVTFGDRIPAATQGNMKEVLKSIQSYRPAWNEWLEVFLDVCALPLYRVNSWQNALGKFKQGRIRNGSWAKEVGYQLIQAHSYDKSATDVFSLQEPEVVVNFHLQNRKDRYSITINEDVLAQAFETEGGLADFAQAVMAQVYNSDEIDEYLIMRELFAMYNETNGFFNYQVPDLAASSDVAEDAKKITAMLKETNEMFKFPNQAVKYNPEHLPYVSGSTVLFATPKFLALNDVYNLAAAFNMDRAEFVAGVVQTVDEIPIEGAQAILADRDWFVCTDTLMETASIQNPATLGVNHFLHHWGIYSASRMAPAVLFSTAADSTWEVATPIVSAVNLAFAEGYTYADKGKNTPLVATVTGTNNPSQGVTFTITGTGGVPLSTNTHIGGNGMLWVGTDEQNAFINVTATSVADPSKSASLPVGIGSVYTPPTITSVTINGSDTITKGTSEQYTVTTVPADSPVVWSTDTDTANAYIDQTGKLTVTASYSASSLNIIATSIVNPVYKKAKRITVNNSEE